MFFKFVNLRHSLLLVAFTLTSNQVFALAFVPTELEWLGWGEMCQARYVVSGAGMNSEFTSRVSKDTVELWKNKVGPKAWYGLHHYCAGLILDNKRGNQKSAISEYLYAFDRIPNSDPLYPVIGSKIAFAHYKAGNTKNATQFALRIINSNAQYADGYLIKGIIERKEKQYTKAIQTLEEGNAKTKGNSAELNYHLALNYYTLENFDAATKYAIVAYELGYPLPWLRDQLKKEGHWL